MAKKSNVDPVYPAAPLIISPKKFVKLLEEQIKKGRELLDINVPKANQYAPYMGYVSRANNRVEYDEAAQNDFFAKFNRWHERNKEIYRSSFSAENSIYFHGYETQVWDHIIIEDIVKDYKEDISRLINQMQADIDRSDLMKCEVTTEIEEEMPQKIISPKVFISHNEEDAPYAHALVDLMRGLGMKYEDIFCSSHPACAIPFGKSILNTVRQQYDDYRLTVLFVHSPRLYGSPVSLCEMGAAWILRSSIYSFLTKDCSFDSLKGVVSKDDIAFKAGQGKTYRVLNDFRRYLENEFKLAPISDGAWDYSKQKFVDRVTNIKYELE